jgi:hypothetical protein
LLSTVDWVLVSVVAVAAGLRFWGLGQSFWFDEFQSASVIVKGSHLVSNVTKQEGTPPLYFMVLWGWTKFFGTGDWALRSLSAVIGTATVPFAYGAAHELTSSRRAARVAAALVAVNPMMVWFSQEVRAYVLLAFLAAVSLFFWARAYKRGDTFDFVLWGVSSAAALTTHYFAATLVVPEALWLGVAFRKQWRRVLQGYAPVALVGLLLFVFFFRSQNNDNLLWVATDPLRPRVAEAGRQALMGPGGWDDRLWIGAAALVVLAVVLVAVWGDRRGRSTAATMAVLGASGVVLALGAAATGNDYFLGRNLIAALVPLLIATAICFGARRAGWAGLAGAVMLCGLSIAVVVAVDTKPDLQKTDWRALATRLDANPRDSIVVIDHDGHLAVPLLRYFKAARVVGLDEPVRITEIDLVYHIPKHINRCGFFQGRVCEPAVFYFPLFPDAVSHEFIYSGKPRVAEFAVNLYRSEGPVTVTPRAFLRMPRQKGLAVFLRRSRSSHR